jgi:asparagine synthetase B (glutamine-hydrolysing)
LEFHLSRAVQMRMDQHSSRGCSTAVLFSGGLDSAVVAALAAQHCSSTSPQQKLLLHNVSFGPSHDKSADRQAALTTFEVLRERYDDHVEFRDIVVEWQDICQHEPHIRTLLQPKTTLMDVNIATALWFASRGGGGGGGGKRSSPSEAEDTSRPPRVLLLGMGADEQMGGYGRHRKAYERGGWDELQSELKMDQDRFWERNLGRDDRICADHGTEARFPFLDAHVVQFLQRLPLHLVCDFSLPPGQGDKRILRLVAQRLGLDHASGLVKRAIQFGSRISHLSDAKRFGSRQKAKGEATVKKNAT